MSAKLWEKAMGLGAQPRHIVHVGAHWAQEAEAYSTVINMPPGFHRTVDWFEADPEAAAVARRRLAEHYQPGGYMAHRVHTALLAEETGKTRPFLIASNHGCSSSMLPFAEHEVHQPETRMVGSLSLTTARLDDYGLEPDWLTLDVQGAEYLVLNGARYTMESVEWVLMEVSTVQHYTGAMLLDGLDRFMESGFDPSGRWPGFKRVALDLSIFDGTHGDALYRRIDS